ncbi:MAG: hypothetical protein Q7T87_12660 [Polaromonas sp.]|nr:hypothetical protein [Polaromonas sp.]
MKKAKFTLFTVVALMTLGVSTAQAEGQQRGNALGDATTMITPKPRKVKDTSAPVAKKPTSQAQYGDSAFPDGQGLNPKSVEERNEAHAKKVAARDAKRGGKPSRVTPVSPSASFEADMKRN